MELTIAIPTYDRNEILHQSLERLLPQLTDECRLVVVDNCSPVPVSSDVKELAAKFPAAMVRVVRNHANIGGNANIMRCFEECETQWLWVLGDDDVVAPDAIGLVLNSLRTNPECSYFTFSSPWLPRTTTEYSTGLEAFLHTIDEFGKILFISTSVFRASQMKGAISVGYQFTYSLAPHIAVLLCSLNQNSVCCFSPDRIILNGLGLAHEGGLPIRYWVSLLALVELPLPHRARVALCMTLKRNVMGYSDRYVMELIQASLSKGESTTSLFAYDLFRKRIDYFCPDVYTRFRTWGQRWLIKYPGVGALVYRVLRGKPLPQATWNPDLDRGL